MGKKLQGTGYRLQVNRLQIDVSSNQEAVIFCDLSFRTQGGICCSLLFVSKRIFATPPIPVIPSESRGIPTMLVVTMQRQGVLTSKLYSDASDGNALNIKACASLKQM
jgi:hypothetical protein